MTGTQVMLRAPPSLPKGERDLRSAPAGAVACFVCSMWMPGRAHCPGDNAGILLQTSLQEKLLALQWCHVR